MLGPAIGAHQLTVFEAEAELGGKDDRVAPALEGTAEQLLVGKRTVRLGGIEKRDAQLDGSEECGDRFLVVGHAVRLAHAHASETEGGDLKPLASKAAGWEHYPSFH
jgi:hypothetical protein